MTTGLILENCCDEQRRYERTNNRRCRHYRLSRTSRADDIIPGGHVSARQNSVKIFTANYITHMGILCQVTPAGLG
jgi:hypothetical protein